MRLIHSAGGVLWRRTSGESVEVAVIGRNRYDDWTLPKGKLEPGENVLAAAVREVWEETGSQAVPHVRLPTVHYLTGESGIEKTVDYWSMRALGRSDFIAGEEVSALRWLDPSEALSTLTYGHDRDVVSEFMALKPVTGVCVLVRHAHAGSAKDWSGPDETRRLDREGVRQAARLAPLLALFKPVGVYAAPLDRCVQTLAPIEATVRIESVFAEAQPAEPSVVADRIRELVAADGRVIVCSQGAVIPDAIAALKPANGGSTASFDTDKGQAWVLSFAGADLVAADPLPVDTYAV